MEARRGPSSGEKTRPGSGTISKTPREVLPLLGFISSGDQPVGDKNRMEGALFISPLATSATVESVGRGKGQYREWYLIGSDGRL